LPQLMELIATEIANANPGASRDDIVREFLSMLENYVVPDVLRKMRPIPRPSPAQLKSQELRMKRAPRGRRERYKQLQYVYDLAIQFDMIRSQLGERELSDATYWSRVIEYPSDRSTTPLFVEEEASSQWNGREFENFQTDPYKPTFRGRLFYEPWISSEERIVSPEPFGFSILEPLQGTVVSDPVLEKIVRNVEVRMRRSFTQTRTKLDLRMLIRQDREIGDWEKIILSIDSEESDFDKKMSVWEMVDAEVMEAIREIEEEASPEERPVISSIKRKMFTDMSFPPE